MDQTQNTTGHWFTILNYVSDHKDFEIKFEGIYPVTDLNGILNPILSRGSYDDAAISAWGIKGFYDYVRPITAIRYMADLGQSTSSNKPNFHPNGIKLVEGLIELVGPTML